MVRTGPTSAVFHPILFPNVRSYTADDWAKCPANNYQRVGPGTDHPIEDCFCGFYAYKRPKLVHGWIFGARLTVDLYGTVGEHETVWRGSRQRVMQVEFPHRCMSALSCRRRAGTLVGRTGQAITSSCLFHTPPKRRIDPSDLQGWLGTEVVFRRRLRTPIPILVLYSWACVNLMAIITGLTLGGTLGTPAFLVASAFSTIFSIAFAEPFVRWHVNRMSEFEEADEDE